MELMMDWRGFQSVFFPHRWNIQGSERTLESLTTIVADQGRVVTALCQRDDLTDWNGADLAEIRAANPDRKYRVVSRNDLHRVVSELREVGNYFTQVDELKKKLLDSEADTLPNHFLLRALTGWWQRFLPAQFGVGIQLGQESGSPRTYFLMVKKGQVVGFHEPDLSVFEQSGRSTPEELSKYLGERYLVPTAVVSAPAGIWNAWAADYNPWGDITRAWSAGQIQIFPKRLDLKSLLILRTWVG